MTTQDRSPSLWMKLPISLRAIVSGLLVALVAANVWPLLLLNLRVPLAAIAEAIFLALYVWWASGGGPPRTTQAARATAFRRGTLSPRQWFWSLIAAFFFAATVHASIVLLFRFVSFRWRHFGRVMIFPLSPPHLSDGWQLWSPRSRRVFAKRQAFVATCSARSKSATARRLLS